MRKNRITYEVNSENELHIAVIKEIPHKRITTYNRVEMTISLLLLIIIFPGICLYLAIIGLNPIISFLLYLVLIYIYNKFGQSVNNKVLTSLYAYEKSYHYFLPLAQEINDTNSDQNSIKLKNGVVNIGLLCFERNLSKSEFIEIGDIIGLDGYKLKDVKRLKNSEVPAVDLNYYIPILVTNENKIFPIMSFEVWHRIHLTKKDTQASHFLASPMNGAFYLMRDIAKQIHFENEDKDDVRCDIGYIFYKRYPDGYGILLRETGKTPLIYDPYRDLKMPEYKLDPDYIGVYRENPR